MEISKKILLNILIILIIITIYLILFPKKSYLEKYIEDKKTPEIEEVFNANAKKFETASINYFDNSKNKKVTLKRLKEKNLITDLIDTTENPCDEESYAEKENEKITIYLKCNDKEEKIEQQCKYQYEKLIGYEYTEWSDWDKTEIKEDNETEVETKIETENEEKDPIKENKIICPDNYEEINGKCGKKIELNTITPSISYKCPEGYKKIGTTCTNETETIEAKKTYYCPNIQDMEFELIGNMCKSISIRYTEPKKIEETNTCEEGYELSNNKCYKEKTKEIKYYRYKKKKEKYDIKWSKENDIELLNKEYNITSKISCEF